MKNVIFIFSMFLVFASSAQAQCSKAAAGKSCCAAKKSASASASAENGVQIASFTMEAEAAVAASNGTITKRTCEMSGTTTYFEKSVCSQSGKVSWDEVKYDADKKAFTKVASASMEKDENGAKVETKSCAGKMEGKACCKSGAAKSCAAQKQSNK
ncbi:MAG: hypothetical protein LW630_01240 [Saprospiraceae bacterium]|jgi:hypothetical protein|nr:hypothetical protein [Saprospiraceae bacterium]